MYWNQKKCELVEVNLKDLLIFLTLSHELTIGYAALLNLSTLLLLEPTELQRIELLRMFLQNIRRDRRQLWNTVSISFWAVNRVGRILRIRDSMESKHS